MTETNTLIIGGSFSGLACAACLGKNKVNYLLIEKADQIGNPWRNHYERLHLHTHKALSHLPHLPFPSKTDKYPSRQEVVQYLDDYCWEMGIFPKLNTEAQRIYKEGERWLVITNKEPIVCENLILASGPFGKPRKGNWKGEEQFQGPILHSSQYKSGRDFRGKRMLVVGFGNSACEIALDLHEQGAFPSLSVRSAVNVLPRDILGIPVLQIGVWMSSIPPKLADKLNAPLIKFLTGDIEKLGLKKLPYGPLEQITTHQQVPLLDLGTLKLIRDGNCPVFGEISHLEPHQVVFKDGKTLDADGIIAAIGYEKNYGQHLMDLTKERIQDLSLPIQKQQFAGKDGLYFCGYYISPTGQIREIASDAQWIAQQILKDQKKKNQVALAKTQ
ncbi:NAD(P)/FAD-dependent oxidoreductase [Algoriphagus confluentis]|uniref:NAD(P)/FAD-dependent oxidoreductase n=1 Tax=Algoriphagus confluentis TaxID=1697556 RepID=A0ABQ6PRA4_9BACT|nr:NAD(P)/FAD-dependent oxidoreductase [Algoriphagus confluentis]